MLENEIASRAQAAGVTKALNQAPSQNGVWPLAWLRNVAQEGSVQLGGVRYVWRAA